MCAGIGYGLYRGLRAADRKLFPQKLKKAEETEVTEGEVKTENEQKETDESLK